VPVLGPALELVSEERGVQERYGVRKVTSMKPLEFDTLPWGREALLQRRSLLQSHEVASGAHVVRCPSVRHEYGTCLLVLLVYTILYTTRAFILVQSTNHTANHS
jgi:hypothetical protein